MTAIVGNAFRKYNADSFIGSFATNKVYLMIGKNDAWASTGAGQYAGSGFSDTIFISPPEAPFPEGKTPRPCVVIDPRT